jgi:TatD DNase family protein
MIDTHCHLVFPDFAGRVDAILAEAATNGVTGALTICTSTNDAEASMMIAEGFDNVWFTVGVHPLYSDQAPHDWKLLKRLAQHKKCVAWGELGLDNHHARPPRSTQDPVLAEQLAFIESCMDDGIDHPVVIHCREAFDELIPILRATRIDGSRFVFHCFTAGPDEVRQILDFGAMVSFTGVVTYKNAKATAEAAKLVPAERIMVETDAPFLSPEPKRGTRPCVPAFSRHTADFLAQLRGVPNAKFLAQINRNTERFFGIPAVAMGEGN